MNEKSDRECIAELYCDLRLDRSHLEKIAEQQDGSVDLMYDKRISTAATLLRLAERELYDVLSVME